MIFTRFVKVFLLISLLLPDFVFARSYYKDQLGLNVHWALGGIDRDDLYEQRLKESKTAWAREHFQTHNFYLEDPENWFARYDAILQKYKENNIQVLGMVAYNESGGKGAPNLDEWRAFLRILVSRYKDYVKYWEVWNEPDSPDYLTPNNPETYAPILSAAYSEIKTVDPQAKVVSAGLSYPNPYFAKKLYQLAGGKFDIFSFHAYYCETYFTPTSNKVMVWGFNEGHTNLPLFLFGPYNDVIKTKMVDPLGLSQGATSLEIRLDQIKEIVEANNPGQKVWITELGCSQNGGRVSERQQLKYFKYVLPKISSKNFVDKIFLYNIRDYDWWTVYENGFGLTSVDLEPKLAWNWYKKIYIGPYNKERLTDAEEKQKTDKLRKKLKKYYGKKNIPKTIDFKDLADAYIYGKYPKKALAQALKFSGKTYHSTIPFRQWKKRKVYKKYINRGWYGGKLVWSFTYKKPRLTFKEEAMQAVKLKQELVKRYKFNKLQISAKNWPSLVNAYIYGEYPLEALARAGKYPQIINPKIPYSRWKESSVYKFYILQKIPK
ncbi:MAG: glycosyl hydrolase [Patescibacteria group bacterium]